MIEPFAQECLGGLVGGGHRAKIDFRARQQIERRGFEDAMSGGGGKFGERFEQTRVLAGAQIDLGDAADVAKGFLADERLKVVWNLPRALLPKNRVKLLLNLLMIASAAIPRGGTLTVDPLGEGENMGFRLRAEGPNARI